MNDEIKEILDRINNYPEKLYCLNENEKHLLLNYITNLQLAIEVKNERIKEEQQEKERYIKFYNGLNVWNKELKQENERLKVNCNLGYEELKVARDYKSRCEKASEKLSFIDEALENDTLNVPLCIAKINSALNILQNGSDIQ